METMRTCARPLTALVLASLSGALGVKGGENFAPALDRYHPEDRHHLGVVVPAYRGDLAKAVSSLQRWPTMCSPLTQQAVDLVLYYAEGDEDAEAVEQASSIIAGTAGRCFSQTKTIFANVAPEDDFYPRGPSVQFFKMFLDEDISEQLREYDALAIIEWDVLVADERSFEELYKAAFVGTDDFWVKGSNVGGTNFHSSAEMQGMWGVLGHINGNAIYNNNDPAFVEYVEYTRTRWDYQYPYDVALWLTISDFPYSWPLWQRYSSKFVTTNLISYVGFERVDRSTVSDAVAGHTLFIHGSSVEDGNLAVSGASSSPGADPRPRSAASRERRRRARRQLRAGRGVEELIDDSAETDAPCTPLCEGGHSSGLRRGTSTVCDSSCAGGQARFDGFMCGAGDAKRFGPMCRACFVDADDARKAQRELQSAGASAAAEGLGYGGVQHVIMCDTMKPPEAPECTEECSGLRYTVCDDSCGSGRYGDYDCNWRGHGSTCRFCFDDLEAARLADDVARRRGGRVIMCDTMEPPTRLQHLLPQSSTEAQQQKSAHERATARHLQLKWQDNEKWKSLGKWKGGVEDDGTVTTVPKWQRSVFNIPISASFNTENVCLPSLHCPRVLKAQEKWKNLDSVSSGCDEGCEYVSADGSRGRMCDDTCSTGDPYGTNGCGAKGGKFGSNCRVCYYDADKAEKQDDPVDRAIMCSTGLPLDVYSRRRALKDAESAPEVAQRLNTLKAKRTPREADEGGLDPADIMHTPRRLLRNPDAVSEPTVAAALAAPAAPAASVTRHLQENDEEETEPWREPQKWKTLDPPKWQGQTDEDGSVISVPKWQVLEKWKTDESTSDSNDVDGTTSSVEDCDEGCEYVSADGSRGRMCDATCATGEPYGTNGCDAKGGSYGSNCRVCYYDTDKAQKRDDPSDRAIMCVDGLPLDVYRRVLTADASKEEDSPAHVARRLQDVPGRGGVGVEESTDSFFALASHRPFTDDINRGEMCAFIAARADEVKRWEVTVTSILQFVPGMRVALAVEEDALPEYLSALDGYPLVSISGTSHAAALASVYADQYCGAGTRLIYYVQPNSVMSRAITSKDTHSPKGDLLVVYGQPRTYRATEDSRLAESLLGHNTVQSFTHGTDLVLPASVNAHLRELLVGASTVPEEEGIRDETAALALAENGRFDQTSTVPQILAALAQAREVPGVWFFNPQAWVSEHLFKSASIWEIPLVKPRFACAIEEVSSDPGHSRDSWIAGVLQDNLDFFSRGGKCENGRIAPNYAFTL